MSERIPNPLVEQFRRGGVPHELRLMAAGGALPLGPADLVELLSLLLKDVDGAVREAATQSLAKTAAEVLRPILTDRNTPAEVLAWALSGRTERELREVVLQNTSTSDEAIEALAADLPTELAELVVINQVRLLRRTSLLEALETNTNLNNDQRRRLRELRESFHIGETPAPAPPSVAPAPPVAPPEPEPEAEVALLDEQQAVQHYLTEEERGEKDKLGAVQRIFKLNTAQKVILALKGSREERTLLIRDPNRMVAIAVLGSPRLTDGEVEAIAAMRNVQGEILRIVGNHKEWSKRYGVVSSLVKNPRTPLGIALGMVSRLNPRDLRSLSTDRNVPEVIRRQALNFVRQAHQR